MLIRALNLFLVLSCFCAHAEADLNSSCRWDDESIGALTPTLEEITRQSGLPQKYLESHLREVDLEFITQQFPASVRKNEPVLLVDGASSSRAINIVRVLLGRGSQDDEFAPVANGRDLHREITTDGISVLSAMGLVYKGQDIVHVSCVRIASAQEALRFHVLNPCLSLFSPQQDFFKKKMSSDNKWSIKKRLSPADFGNYACYVSETVF